MIASISPDVTKRFSDAPVGRIHLEQLQRGVLEFAAPALDRFGITVRQTDGVIAGVGHQRGYEGADLPGAQQQYSLHRLFPNSTAG